MRRTDSKESNCSSLSSTTAGGMSTHGGGGGGAIGHEIAMHNQSGGGGPQSLHDQVRNESGNVCSHYYLILCISDVPEAVPPHRQRREQQLEPRLLLPLQEQLQDEAAAGPLPRRPSRRRGGQRRSLRHREVRQRRSLHRQGAKSLNEFIVGCVQCLKMSRYVSQPNSGKYSVRIRGRNWQGPRPHRGGGTGAAIAARGPDPGNFSGGGGIGSRHGCRRRAEVRYSMLLPFNNTGT